MMCDGPASTDADRVSRNDQRRRQLPAFEFVRGRLNAIENILHETRLEAGGDDLARCGFLFEVELQHAIELVVRRQRLIVKLSRRELSGGTLVDDRSRNDFFVAIEIVRERI